MKPGLTATLVVCVAAAGVAVGALAIDAGDSDPEPDADPAGASGDPAEGGGGGGYGGGAPSGGGAAGADTATLVVDDFDFSAVTVAPGATVSVENRDGFQHTVTAENGSFDTGTVDAGAGSSFVAPSGPGAYQITCSIHPQMSGTLTVG